MQSCQPRPGCCCHWWDLGPFPGLGDTNQGGGTQLGLRAMTVTTAETQWGGEEGDRAQGAGPRALSVTLAS